VARIGTTTPGDLGPTDPVGGAGASEPSADTAQAADVPAARDAAGETPAGEATAGDATVRHPASAEAATEPSGAEGTRAETVGVRRSDRDGVDAEPAGRASARAVGLLVLVAVVVLIGDAVAKYFVVRDLTDHAPVRTLGGLVYLDLIRNSGAAFSMLSGQTWVFTVVAAAAVGWIAWLATRLRSLSWAVALGLVLGGALGNLADRVFRAPGFLVGHVVDYISLFGPDGQHFAIFNLADAMLCCGVALAVLLELGGRRRDGSRAARRSAA
jgi:signal peptidase II